MNESHGENRVKPESEYEYFGSYTNWKSLMKQVEEGAISCEVAKRAGKGEKEDGPFVAGNLTGGINEKKTASGLIVNYQFYHPGFVASYEGQPSGVFVLGYGSDNHESNTPQESGYWMRRPKEIGKG